MAWVMPFFMQQGQREIMVIRLNSAGWEGVDAYRVDVEVELVRQGLPAFSMVGLAEAAVREARDRVFAALRAGQFRLPPARITVNLAPAGRRKSGTAYDLPLALGLLMASGQLPPDCLADAYVAGELSLSGAVRPVSGVLPLAILARRTGARCCIVPPANGQEAAVVDRIFRKNGFEVVSVICKTGSIPKDKAGVPQQFRVRPGTYEVMCNPIAQARLLAEHGTDLNVIVGLCVGHDTLFIKHSEAPVTYLIVKDRVLAHNPAGALHAMDTYYRRLLDPDLPEPRPCEE